MRSAITAPPTTEKTMVSRRVKRVLFGVEFGVWDILMLISLGFAALAAVAVVFTTLMALRAQKVETVIARQETARANEAAGTANERAAELEKEAADAKQETERLKQITAWRSIPNVSALIDALKANPRPITIRYVANDPETAFFALQIAKAFEAAKWSVNAESVVFSKTFVWGVHVPTTSFKGANDIRMAFEAAQIGFVSAAIDEQPLSFSGGGIRFGTAPPPPTAVVIVGPKQPPL